MKNNPENLSSLSGNFTPEELANLTKLQREMQERFYSVPSEGKEVEYLGQSFLVKKDMFWPFEDSMVLAKNMIIHPGESVLDVGTGSGLLAILAAQKGAGKVVAIDINPAAIEVAQINIAKHNLEEIIETKFSDLFTELADQTFDLIITNPPFRNIPAKNLTEAASWDTHFSFHKRFFQEARSLLNPGGRIYLVQANYGDLEKLQEILEEYKYTWQLMGTHNINDETRRSFFALEIQSS